MVLSDCPNDRSKLWLHSFVVVFFHMVQPKLCFVTKYSHKYHTPVCEAARVKVASSY